eukprot:CAMPEP_0172479832 /NCGR_PEP_ID=MMETSP1066-20121228/4655_1 /TAXON_ID=671091 /ORGANISM="Coscinodiscus wailesii, Strain CCMP2513" /LENGTH=443 /DNA_ID=CAMNT_0013240635 /DNA_START=192 /DNA_END=1523 /DNA_ORIENTATION=+
MGTPPRIKRYWNKRQTTFWNVPCTFTYPPFPNKTSLTTQTQTGHSRHKSHARPQRQEIWPPPPRCNEITPQPENQLNRLRDKGGELELATATSTVAVAAQTVQRERDHQRQTNQVLLQQEKLMKFQFMSMSLSYFSGLKMLRQMRDFNVETTAEAVTNAAQAASVAAAAAAAANVPSVKNVVLRGRNVGGEDVDDEECVLAEKEAKLRHATEEVQNLKSVPEFPDNVRLWTIDHVSMWLRTLSLHQYVSAFRDACVDGDFLLELREEEMSSVLGIEHKLHRRKIVLGREKLRPLDETEVLKKNKVAEENDADAIRRKNGLPDPETVFSQARHGRLKRLQESLDDGFETDAEDEKGNTVLCVACQNSHFKMVDFLLRRGANVNHANANGNTPLHYALAYDGTGRLAEFLIERGADDNVENVFGLTCYDGLGDEEEDMGEQEGLE